MPREIDVLIGFHISLPMGFVDSCPYFCVVTETITDMFNQGDTAIQPTHLFELLANTAPLPKHECHVLAETMAVEETHLEELFLRASLEAQSQILRYIDVYIDYFILLQQGASSMRWDALCKLLHTIDEMIHPNDEEDHTRTEPNSTKKLKLRDRYFSTFKKLLG